MGFNWRLMLAWFACIATADIGSGLAGLSKQAQFLLDLLVLLAFFALTMSLSVVARHNLRQLFKSDGHQYIGDGLRCEECNPSLEVAESSP